MQQKPFGQEEVGTSQFYMIRCVIAMAHADNIVTHEERGYVISLIRKMPFNHEQREQLLADLETAQKVSDLLPYINEPKYRGQVVYFARLLAYKDGELHPSEDELLRHLHLAVTQNLDMDAIRADVRYEVGRQLVIHEAKIDAQRPEKGLFGLIDRFLVYCGIDLMDE